MKKLMRGFGILGVAVGTIGLILISQGCVTSKTAMVTGDATTGFSTNIVVTVNTNNLALDCAGIQVVTAVGVNAALNASHNDPGVINALKNAQVALGGILNGTNPQTTSQVVALLNAQGNPALTQQVTQLVQSLSAVEQNLLAKYGATVAGQISVAITQAVYSGLTVGLAGH